MTAPLSPREKIAWMVETTLGLGVDPVPGCALCERPERVCPKHAGEAIADALLASDSWYALSGCGVCGAVSHSWKPGNWWRMVSPDGEVTVKAGREDRVRKEAKPGDTIQQVYLQLVERWQDEAKWPRRRPRSRM